MSGRVEPVRRRRGALAPSPVVAVRDESPEAGAERRRSAVPDPAPARDERDSGVTRDADGRPRVDLTA